ncbi:hypothetical protein Ciccas_011501 [Cichlidogyrus casuarinus]|uniref:Transcription elongation factor 1 homolog n=1 Tax=Cichlidogyrus casuarinus TaxID=1844966 RepID=A0ABD2PR27_9PLAT
MGKAKSARKPAPKPKILLPPVAEFNCPFCYQIKTCSVVIDRSTKKGFIVCENCKVSFGTTIHDLYQPIDVYNDWIDSCERINS